MEGIEVKQSRVAAWSKTKARGLWLKGGYKIKRGMIIGVYGMMNEDIHEYKVNAHFEGMGIIRAVQNLIGPCEILTDYGDEYDWDEVKEVVYKSLKKELASREKWINNMKAGTMKEARKGNGLEKYMARIVDGELEQEELHSTTLAMGEEESIEWMLTSGAQIEWYFFGNYGGTRNEYRNKDLHRENQRTSGEKRYAQKWLEEETIVVTSLYY